MSIGTRSDPAAPAAEVGPSCRLIVLAASSLSVASTAGTACGSTIVRSRASTGGDGVCPATAACVGYVVTGPVGVDRPVSTSTPTP